MHIEINGDNRIVTLITPPGSFPGSPRLVSDSLCEADESGYFDYSFEFEPDVSCPTNITEWDLGTNVSLILNHTTQLMVYGKKQMDDCKSAVDFNMRLQAQLDECNNKSAILNTYSSLQSAYDVCDDNRRTSTDSLKVCQEELKKKTDERFNFFIYGLIVAAIYGVATKPKLYQPPTQKQFGRG
jgi:hypothetical protein